MPSQSLWIPVPFGKFHKAQSVNTTATVLIWPDGLLWDVACSLLGFHWAVYLPRFADIHMEITGDYYRLLEYTYKRILNKFESVVLFYLLSFLHPPICMSHIHTHTHFTHVPNTHTILTHIHSHTHATPTHMHLHTHRTHTPQASSANSSQDYDTAKKLGRASLAWNIGVYIFNTLAIIAIVVAVVVVQVNAVQSRCIINAFGRTVCY